MKNEECFTVIGLMSGTSLDGLDIAACSFEKTGERWKYRIIHAVTIEYPLQWKKRLSSLMNGSASDFAKTDIEYGQYLGISVKNFIEKTGIEADFISSHGHTVFHDPANKITSQIGKGSAIAAETSLPVICDFRSTDVALGGQGAPLVPVGDRFLFPGFGFCLNLGGFANISFEKENRRIAFDICPVNTVLNLLAGQAGKDYDEGGNLASTGTINESLLKELNTLPYYRQEPPKSLGKEWLAEFFLPVLERYDIPVPDKLRTVCEHISVQVSKAIGVPLHRTLLITGGGAFNSFLVDRIMEKSPIEIVLPDPVTINFKEALIFAFLGLLRWREEINCLSSVTGASSDSCGGVIWLPAKKNL